MYNDTQLYCNVTHCTALHYTSLHCTALHCTALHCTALHCTALHCIALHCSALYYKSPSTLSGCPHKSLLGAGELAVIQEPAVEDQLGDVLDHDEDRVESEVEQEVIEGVSLVLSAIPLAVVSDWRLAP